MSFGVHTDTNPHFPIKFRPTAREHNLGGRDIYGLPGHHHAPYIRITRILMERT